MSSYLAAAALNMANLVVKSLDQQLMTGDASRYQGPLDKLSGFSLALVNLTETKTGFGYGALEYQLVLGVPNRARKQVTFSGDDFSGVNVLDFKSAYVISFRPQITLAFPPTYDGKWIREVMDEDGSFSDKFIQPEEIIDPTLAKVAKYLNVCLRGGVVMQPGYEFVPVTVTIYEKNSDDNGAQIISGNETQLFQLSQIGLSQLESICESSWRQVAAG